jgi:autotransporter-associated beta strand protein
LYSISGSNYLGGPITLETNVQVRSDESSGCLTLAGNIQGPGNLVVSGTGPLRLSGINTYATNTIVATSLFAASGGPRPINICASIPAGQFPEAGNYTDTVTVTVTFA